ncbi:MAG: FtsQ-type POTRA domain-containing protein [Acidobacteriaceae bacterium]|nr:FtsQ-type POTRA domain-containing protein [Acidobacteriaceae bacterium]
MPRRQEPEEQSRERFRWVLFTFWLIVGLILMVSTLFAWHSTEEFLIRDDRFRLAESEDFRGRSPNLVVEGVQYASTSQIRHVFAEDFGRSLYLVPIEKRRLELLQIDWVEDATVSKVWPNTLRVFIHERIPVAFVRLAPNRKDGMSRLALIDRDGHILRPRIPAQFTLPVLTGIRESETLENRRARVRRVLGMLKEIGPLAEQVSEINVADPNNLILAEHVDNTVVNLMLGDDNYAERLQGFLNNHSAIREKRPDAKMLDLRVDGVITAVGRDGSGE